MTLPLPYRNLEQVAYEANLRRLSHETQANFERLAQELPVVVEVTDVAHADEADHAADADHADQADELLNRVISSYGKAAWGNDVVNFPGTQTSTAATVNHGLGATPSSVQITSRSNGVTFICSGRNSTSISVVGYYIPGMTSGNVFFDWLALT